MKTFSTITLRNLDSKQNTDVVEILNYFMMQNEIKTGQSAIEQIIREYDKLYKLVKDLQTEKITLEKKLFILTRDSEAENQSLRKTLNTFINFLNDIQQIQKEQI